MSLEFLKIFRNNQNGLIWKLKFWAFIGEIRSTSKYRQNKCQKLFRSWI